MVEQKVKITHPLGLELRPAGDLCQLAVRYSSRITIQYGVILGTANAKSILGVLGASMHSGDEVTLICEGEDEEEALSDVVGLLCEGVNVFETI